MQWGRRRPGVAVCSLLGRSVVAVIGPGTSSSVRRTHPLCAGLHVPHLSYDATDTRLSFTEGEFKYLVKVGVSLTSPNLTVFDLTTQKSIRLWFPRSVLRNVWLASKFLLETERDHAQKSTQYGFVIFFAERNKIHCQKLAAGMAFGQNLESV